MAKKVGGYQAHPITTNLLRFILGIEISACAISLVITLWPLLLVLSGTHGVYWSAIHCLRFLPFLSTLSLLFWIFRANANARALSSVALDHSPIWAVGWFFVPMAALFKPWTIMMEIYRSSRPPLDWRENRSSLIVTAWWLIRLLADLIGLVNLKARFDPQDIVTNGMLSFWTITIVHQALLLIIIARVGRWQMVTHNAAKAF